MLDLPNLNDQQMNEILENVMLKLQNSRSSWKDLDVHDPGITIVESFIVMKAQQQKQINKIGMRSLRKFLKMLEIPWERVKPASTLVSFVSDKNITIKKGMQLKAYDLIFEVDKDIHINKNKINFLKSSIDNINRPHFDVIKREDFSLPMFNEKFNEFYIAFESPFIKKHNKNNKNISIYFSVVLETFRNEINAANEFYNLGENIWQFYGLQDGVLGWHDLYIVSDETYNFIFSGCVNVRFTENCQTASFENVTLDDNTEGFFIRIVNTFYAYEKPPCINDIILNCCELSQKRTFCQNIKFSYEDFLDDAMFFSSPLALNAICELYVFTENGYILAADIDVLFRFKEIFEGGYFRFGTSKRDELKLMFESLENFSKDSDAFMLVIYDKAFYPHRFLGSGDGTANKELEIFGNDKICYDDFELIVKSKKAWEHWEKIDSLDETKGETLFYILNEETNVVRFGDNINGKVPTIGKDNICITSLVTTKAELGDLKENSISEFKNFNPNFNIDIIHFKSSTGGKSAPTSSELLKNIKSVMEETNHAVTAFDYEELAFKTPGLSLGSVTVIPLYEKDVKQPALNTVTVVVEPYCIADVIDTLEVYVKNVQAHLEKFRLLTTRICVIHPTYIPLDILGEIHLVKNNFYDSQQYLSELNKIVRDYIYDLQKNKLGITIQSSYIQQLFEQQHYVGKVKYLQVEVPYKNVTKNYFGDISVPPYTHIYFRESQIILS